MQGVKLGEHRRPLAAPAPSGGVLPDRVKQLRSTRPKVRNRDRDGTLRTKQTHGLEGPKRQETQAAKWKNLWDISKIDVLALNYSVRWSILRAET